MKSREVAEISQTWLLPTSRPEGHGSSKRPSAGPQDTGNAGDTFNLACPNHFGRRLALPKAEVLATGMSPSLKVMKNLRVLLLTTIITLTLTSAGAIFAQDEGQPQGAPQQDDANA
ncbi:MAG TPA: hypothetical protein VJV74_07690, partial [Terriglobia bacterium]|nr:hypothetical protein [Terriglobia bacterium]